MICANCGKKAETGEKFCTNCGNELNVSKIEKQQNENIVEDNNSIPQEKIKKKKNKTLIIIIGILLVVALAAFLIFKFIIFSPKNIFFKGINEAYSNINEEFNEKTQENDKYKDKIISLKTNTTFDLNANEYYFDSTTLSIFDLLNKIGLELNETIDNKTNNFDMDLILSNDSGNFNVEANKRDNEIYFKLLDIYDKYISVPFETNINTTTISKENIDYVTKTMKNIFLNSLDDSKFTKENTSLTINEEELNLVKVSYEFDATETKRIAEVFIKEIKNDEKLLEILSNSSNTKNFINSLEEFVSQIDTTLTNKAILSVYTKGLLNEVVAYDLYIKSEDASFKILFTNYKDVVGMRISANGMTMLTATSKEISDNESEITISALTATSKIQTKTFDKTTTMTIALNEISSGTDFDGKVEYINDNNKGNIDMNFKLNIGEDEIFDLKTKTTYEILNGELKQINEHDFVSADEMDETVMQEIMVNLQSNEFLISIMNSLMEY